MSTSETQPRQREVGDRLGGYIVERREPLEHLQGTYYELRHEKTGARHIHLNVPDDNNFFNVQFPTVPKDSTGVAHILEHCVLTGSERFPVRDPFSSMSPRSLKTFMNAFTSNDATSYPFSTRNRKDFFNLLDVYLDSVFFPRLRENAFKQEGHRLEFEDPSNPESGLRFKGVVFNEMKGAMASPIQVLYKSLGHSLYPDLTYANNSGGDPENIPDLTYEQLKEFHRYHYHPSNGMFFTYGNLPLDEILEQIEEKALSRFEPLKIDVTIPDQPRFDSSREFRATYPLSKDEDPAKKAQVLIAWITTHVGDSFQVLGWEVMQEVLLGNAASPLRKALIDSGLGDALSELSGFNTYFREAPFSVGLKNINEEDAEKVEEIVLGVLRELVASGVDPEQIDSAVHQLEISQREVSNAGAPYAWKVLTAISGAYSYGGDPYRSLQFDQDFARIREEMEKGGFFERVIQEFLLDNPHRVRIVLAPDQNLEETQKQTELARLAEIEKQLGDEEKRRIVEDAAALKQEQEGKQDLSVLPTLELSDVPMEFEDVPYTVETISGAQVWFFPQPTNGLSYVDVRFDYSSLSDELKNYLPLFAYVVPKMGAGADDYLKMAARIDAYTGGISIAAGVRPVAAGDGSFLQPMALTGKGLTRNHGPFLEIYRDLISRLQFDPKRLKELIAEMSVQREALVLHNGMLFAQALAASKLTSSTLMAERLGGLTNLALLKSLAKEEVSLDDVLARLEEIKGSLLRNSALNVCVTAEEKHFDELRDLLQDTLPALDSAPAGAPVEVPAPTGIVHEAKTTSVPVAFNAKVYPTVTHSHPDAPALAVLGRYMQNYYLLREIREKGGAYGTDSSFEREEGFFGFWSYRDPNIVRTYEVFDAAVREMIKGEIEDEKVKESILTSCGAVDPLLSPDTKGRRRFANELAGYTLELQEAYKKGLLEVTERDLRRVAEKYLTGDNAAMATIASAPQIEEVNKEMGNVFQVSAI